MPRAVPAVAGAAAAPAAFEVASLRTAQEGVPGTGTTGASSREAAQVGRAAGGPEAGQSRDGLSSLRSGLISLRSGLINLRSGLISKILLRSCEGIGVMGTNNAKNTILRASSACLLADLTSYCSFRPHKSTQHSEQL
jgi:hypothetical protein